jgi:hypothetical protein
MGEQVKLEHGQAPVPTVLYLDDDTGNRQAFQAGFRREFRILLASNFKEASTGAVLRCTQSVRVTIV